MNEHTPKNDEPGVWAVRTVGDLDARDDLLANGWEPFAVTQAVPYEYRWHLRVKVPTEVPDDTE